MKRTWISFILVAFLFAGCASESSSPNEPNMAVPNGNSLPGVWRMSPIFVVEIRGSEIFSAREIGWQLVRRIGKVEVSNGRVKLEVVNHLDMYPNDVLYFEGEVVAPDRIVGKHWASYNNDKRDSQILRVQ